MSQYLKHTWSLLRNYVAHQKNKFVGCDLAGNRYFEGPPISEGYKTRRFILRRNKNEAGDIEYYNSEHIPPQWHAWLRHTRPDAPTISELEIDVARQASLQQKIRDLELKQQQNIVPNGIANSSLKHHSNQLFDTSKFKK